MIKEKENEAKSLLSFKDYKNIETFLEKNYQIKEIKISDIYFDDIKRTLKKKNSVLRLRKENEDIYLNFKEKLKDGSSNEKKLILNDKTYEKFMSEDKEEFLKKFDLNIQIEKIASYKILRKKVILKDIIIDLDITKFTNKEDYEIEIESSSLKKAKEFLKDLLLNQGIKPQKSQPKIARYFNEKKDTNFNFSFNDIILVVEGKSDYNIIRKISKEVEIFITGGLGLDDKKIQDLKNISKNHNKKIVVLTDPDVPGEIIRNKIEEKIDNVYHLYANKDLANKNKNIGIENMSIEDIKKIFSNKLYKKEKLNKKYTISDLINIGIYNDKKKRMEFCNKHSISYGNNKKVLRQINNYGIDIFC